MDDSEKNWKLKLRYGHLTTPYKHYSVIAEGEVDELSHGYDCPKGNAFMGMKIWAENIEECADVYQSIAEQIGFTLTRDIKIYTTEPDESPGEDPYGYDIKFTPF